MIVFITEIIFLGNSHKKKFEILFIFRDIRKDKLFSLITLKNYNVQNPIKIIESGSVARNLQLQFS